MNSIRRKTLMAFFLMFVFTGRAEAQENWKPFQAPAIERQKVFSFTSQPAIRFLGDDQYEITFAVKGFCDVTVAIMDDKGNIVRHVGAGVLGSNAPEPFQKNARKQRIIWDGKNDMGVYVKDPEQLSLRVMLGLKPTFEKRLGGTSPYNLPGQVWGISATPEGVFIFSVGKYSRLYLRKFGLDGKYIKTLIPPPANLPREKFEGMGYIEYEPGKRSIQARRSYNTVADGGHYLTHRAALSADCQPAIAGNKIYYCDAGITAKLVEIGMYNVHLDGSMDQLGTKGRLVTWPLGRVSYPRMAASPDGKWIYLATGPGMNPRVPLVFRIRTDETGPAEPFLGKFKENSRKKGRYKVSPGSENGAFQQASGIDCDKLGQIYVSDQENNRVQVFSPDGKFIKSIKVDKPQLVRVHQKTGSIYVLHSTLVRGKATGRITKFASLQNPKETYHIDGVSAAAFALDSWSSKPRLWIGGGRQRTERNSARWRDSWTNIEVYEEDGKSCRKIMDFDKMVQKEDGDAFVQRWYGWRYDKLACDPIRNILYTGNQGKGNPIRLMNLVTGKYIGHLPFSPSGLDDIAFDKRGYMHLHFNPGFYTPGIGRVDPSRIITPTNLPINYRPATKYVDHPNPTYVWYPEVPYDYGVYPKKDALKLTTPAKVSGRGNISVDRLRTQWNGIIPVSDQLGAKYFQDGLGVNMRGDVAEECNIYYVPKMADLSAQSAMQGGVKDPFGSGSYGFGTLSEPRIRAMQRMEEMHKKGVAVYSIKRKPGSPLSGGTIWTFDSTGELRDECAMVAGDIVNGVQIDQDGDLYFVNARIRAVDGQAFLRGKGGLFGTDKANHNVRNPLTGTLFKVPGKGARIILNKAPIPLVETPNRKPDLIATNWAAANYIDHTNSHAWVENEKWLYAGASPITFRGCSCPSLRIHTDWFKRTYVPEAYRNSIGVVDSNGNLIMHIGEYGNHDSAMGLKSAIKVGDDGISITHVRFVSGTEDRLVYEDNSERIVVLKLNYHAEGRAKISKAGK